jgi:sialate O-acetylesterase
MTHTRRIACSTVAAVAACAALAVAEVRVAPIFGDHMVLQRDQRDKVWGWANPGEAVTVTIDTQTHKTTAGADGKWSVTLQPMPAGGPHTLTLQGSNTLRFEDVLVGEVWICSGQSNMELPVSSANDAEIEKLTAKFPKIRLISVPRLGTQEPQSTFDGKWELCTPETVASFSAVGYYFGRQLHQTLDVPVGLIDNAWGGSACEAWIRRDLLEADARYKPLLARWAELERDSSGARAAYDKALADWKVTAEKAKSEGRRAPAQPQSPDARLRGNARPANIYNGVLKPTIGYGIRGAIWYQGEANANRGYEYREMFPLMIRSWREEWGIGDFSFYWVQLADYLAEKPDPGESMWAELREAQTMTLSRLPATGEAVIIDLGEAQDIHPRNKQDVAKRLARWALARDYGFPVAHRSPIYKSMETEGSRIRITFDHAGAGLKPFDVAEPRGFAIAGSDQKFVWAQAKVIAPDKVEVWSDAVERPVAVRYGWADNPRCNLYSREGLPVTPFRTDDWPGVSRDFH